MADLKPIEYPHHLNETNLTEQELVNLSPSQQALAKDWNVVNRKLDWTMNRIVELYNLIVEHDHLLDIWKFWIKLASVLFGTSGLVGIVYMFSKIIGK